MPSPHHSMSCIESLVASQPQLRRSVSCPATRSAVLPHVRSVAENNQALDVGDFVFARSAIGCRSDQEDTFAAGALDGDNGSTAYAGVFDGHAGEEVSRLCARGLHLALVQKLVFDHETPETALRRVIAGWEEDCMTLENDKVGAAVVVAVVDAHIVTVAHVGDTRAVLCRAGCAVPLTSDHKPDIPAEQMRIEAAGGFVRDCNGMCRALGMLAMSRAVGDRFMKPMISAEPDVACFERHDADQFLLLASDGLWDAFNSEAAVRCAHSAIRQAVARGFLRPQALRMACTVLVRGTLARRGCLADNVTVVIVDVLRKGAQMSHI